MLSMFGNRHLPQIHQVKSHISLNKEENPINKNVDEKTKIIINKNIDEKIKTINGSLFLKHQKHALFKVPWCKENINTQRTFFLFFWINNNLEILLAEQKVYIGAVVH